VPYLLEANPNPEIAESQEFAAAAKHDGIKYRDLLHRILTLGMQRAAGDGGAGRESLRLRPAGLICGTTKQRSKLLEPPQRLKRWAPSVAHMRRDNDKGGSR
jgi:hypothetical protein